MDEPTIQSEKQARFSQILVERLGNHRQIEGLLPAEEAYLFSSLYRENGGLYVWVCRDNLVAEQTASNLAFFLDGSTNLLLIPGFETDPYNGLSPHAGIAARRALGLGRLGDFREGFVVTTLHSLLTRIPSPSQFLDQCLRIETGDFIPRKHLIDRLRERGYIRDDPVRQIGDFALRGGIIDIFSPASEFPIRLEFFGDEVESIRTFDPGNQRSIELRPSCRIVPMRELVPSESEIMGWGDRAADFWQDRRFASALAEKVNFTSSGELFNGFEFLFPLVVPLEATLLSYLESEDFHLVIPQANQLWDQLESISKELASRYQETVEEGELALEPSTLFWEPATIQRTLSARDSFLLEQVNPDGTGLRFDFRRERRYQGRYQELIQDFQEWLAQGERAALICRTRGFAERIGNILSEYDLHITVGESLDELSTRRLCLLIGALDQGFYSPSLRLHLLTQENILDESPSPKPRQQETRRDFTGTFISDFRDLKKGDYVVHNDHGIGVFENLSQIGVGSDPREFMVLRYQGGDKLYVPADRLDLVQKFSSAEGVRPKVDRLGGASWQKTKRRVKKAMRNLADELLKLYAKREVSGGFAFAEDDHLMRELEDSFEFEETPDQAAAIQDVKRDMESPQPMDRLVCGDVGYGKTEVAIRAAFKAVANNKQVAILAPTTVLAFQHRTTLKERFAGFPVTVEMLSRLRNRQEQKATIESLKTGLTDIVVGTHRILSKDVQFRDLGLIIVDEEQRFGVQQKERLKQLKTRVDVLTLSATPIPRTLNMSLIGLRDLSLIETPPKDRLSIQTNVVRFNRNVIRGAIEVELKRGGQVFFVHNRIETIFSIAKTVQELVPNAKVVVAHGQMKPTQIENIMLDFVQYRFDVLVSTTIIENGLDIPRANTLLINQANRFGLAQLYQLRGRVGRANRRAYAYFLISSEEGLTPEARKRLAALKEFSELGAGFRLAALDLEIRGAGNLLGGEQSGHINAIGFELYSKLLEETIREMKGDDVPIDLQTTIDLKLDIRIPEHYVVDPSLRLWLYKKISAAPDRQTLERVRDEMADRFGKPPRSISNLFDYAQLRQKCQQLRVLNLEKRGSRIWLKFRDDTPISASKLVERVTEDQDLSLQPDGQLALKLSNTDAVFEAVKELLDKVAMLE